MGEVVVVQGTAVQGTVLGGDSSPHSAPTYDANFSKGEKQETKCRDPIFAFLLYANVIAIAVVVVIYQKEALAVVGSNSSSGEDFSGYVYAGLICGAFAMIFSGLMLVVMMWIPSFLIKTALIFVVVLSGLWAAYGFIIGAYVMGIFGAIFFLLGVCYARAVWPRIPFATANLVTGCTAIRGNCGVIFTSFLFEALAFGWTILWCLACFGTFSSTYSCSTVNGNEVCTSVNYGYLFLLLLSFFFTHQVIQNTVHVIVAGTVGSWWFSPEDSGCCSAGILGSTIRALTTSFGSICFGSLIVAIIQALKSLAQQARQNGDNAILACIAECILGCLQSLNRGWDAIIADDLIGNVLFLVSIIVGGLTGVVGIIVQTTSPLFDNAPGNQTAIAFGLGFIVGLVLCSIFLGSIASAVNAVIVLFAEAPAEFQQNYPELSNQMRTAWSDAFPGSV
ncbi:choline transporter-like protein [Fragilaria crotonensis]|nr:choline transporter-like protein [Fragilaria crotonensis]